MVWMLVCRLSVLGSYDDVAGRCDGGPLGIQCHVRVAGVVTLIFPDTDTVIHGTSRHVKRRAAARLVVDFHGSGRAVSHPRNCE